MPTFDGSRSTIHYEQWLPYGEPTGIVVLVHGYAEKSDACDRIGVRLREAGGE